MVMRLKQFISEFRGYCMDFHNIRFSYVSWIGNYKKMDWGGNDLVRGEWNDTYHSYKLRRALWKPKNFWRLQEPDTHYWGLFTTMTEIFFRNGYFWNISLAKKLAWRSMPIPNFGVNTTVVNPVDIFCSWCKLKFGVFQGQVKSYHFPERIVVKKQYFYFLYIFLGIIGWKRHWTTLLDMPLNNTFWIHYYLLHGTGLDFHRNNSCWIQQIPNFTTNNIIILVFNTQGIVWSRKITLCIIYYLKSSVPWLPTWL